VIIRLVIFSEEVIVSDVVVGLGESCISDLPATKVTFPSQIPVVIGNMAIALPQIFVTV
jgi:hypothetical protein